MDKTELNKYENDWYKPGKNALMRLAWYFVNAIIFNSSFFPFNVLKISLLKLFGATIGKGVVIKPKVNIKYPWRLSIGDNSWVGENVWIDNLDNVIIRNNCCLSQGAFLLTGNHNYKSPKFDLKIGKIELEDGSWVGAKSIVTQNVTLKSHSILSAGSLTSKDLDAYFIYQGNPAHKIRKREL